MNAGKILTQLAENPLVRGIRQIINYEPSWPRNEQLGDLLSNARWREGYAKLENHSLSFDLQLNPHQFKDAVSLVEKHPETPVIIFFQAEDGIRDLTVTGVQTCALPICLRRSAGISGVIT